MGTQQILMIVLSVIVVGAAVAVGIQMFDTQATNAQRQAMAADMQNFGGQILAYVRTPKMMGGSGGALLTADDLANLRVYLGFTSSGGKLINANADYVIDGSVTGGKVVITGTKDGIEVTGTIDSTPSIAPESAISVAFTK